MNARLALAALTATALAGSLAGASGDPTAAPSGSAVYHAKASGRTVTVEKGDTFKVSLQACGDCGQRWSFAQRPASSVLQVKSHKTVAEAKPPAVGGNDHQVWTFRAANVGKTKMRIVERSAERSNKVVKRFTLTVEVQPGLVVD